MKVILNTYSLLAASLLQQQVIRALKQENKVMHLATWSYVKSKEQFDIIFHNLDQYTKEPEKNVIFWIYVKINLHLS